MARNARRRDVNSEILELPRVVDDPDMADPEPHEELRSLFHRVRASLSAWMQALDHLKKG